MRTITWAAIIALLLCVPSLGQDSTIAYRLGLGGYNHVTLYEGSANYYPPFDTTNAVYSDMGTHTFNRAEAILEGEEPTGLYLGPNLTWHVEVEASGMHEGQTINGAANMVFTLALYVGDTDDTLAGAIVYHSTINDGVADGLRGEEHGKEDEHNAAFCFVYNVGENGPTANAGRLWDPYTNGGPLCDRKQFPSAHGEADDLLIPLAVAVDAGMLVGMGAGYSEYAGAGCIAGSCGSGAGGNTGGIGMDVTGYGWDGLGVNKPLFEGQIDTCALAEGTYTLVLVATDAENQNVSANILDGVFDHEFDNPGAFAHKAATVVEDAITFVVIGTCPTTCTKPVAQTVVSRKVHGTSYVGDIVLYTGGAPTNVTECRDLAAAGQPGTMQIIVEYDINVKAGDGSLDAGDEVSLVCCPANPDCNDYIDTLEISGKLLTINLAGLPWEFPKTNGALKLTINVSGIADANAPEPAPGSCIEGDPSYTVCILRGDVDGDGIVSAPDLGIVKDPTVLFKHPSNPPFNMNILRADIDRDDSVAAPDLGIVKDSRVLYATCPTCP